MLNNNNDDKKIAKGSILSCQHPNSFFQPVYTRTIELNNFFLFKFCRFNTGWVSGKKAWTVKIVFEQSGAGGHIPNDALSVE